MKPIKTKLSEEATKIYDNLEISNSKEDRMLFKAINSKIELIKQNPLCGNPYPKNQIPKKYLLKYNVTNLYRIELPLFWRMLYTLEDGENQIEIIALILDVVDHKDYNKLHGY